MGPHWLTADRGVPIREEKYLTFMKLARGDLSEDDLAAWIRERVVKSSRSVRR